jgi:hypothetical protein
MRRMAVSCGRGAGRTRAGHGSKSALYACVHRRPQPAPLPLKGPTAAGSCSDSIAIGYVQVLNQTTSYSRIGDDVHGSHPVRLSAFPTSTIPDTC